MFRFPFRIPSVRRRIAAALASATVCALPLLLCGCIATIRQLIVPAEVAAGEEFSISLAGIVEGDEAGIAGVALQVPSSWKYERAFHTSKYARRPMRRQRRAEEHFQPEEGYQVIVLGDSGIPPGEQRGEVRALVTFTAQEAGSFSLKAVAGGAPRRGGAAAWRSTDPPKIYRFSDLSSAGYTASVAVVDPETNGTSCIAFDGEQSYVALPPAARLPFAPDSSFTIEWLFRTAAEGNVMVSARRDDFRGAHRLEAGIGEEGKLYLTASDGYEMRTLRDTAFVADGAWHHAAVTFSGASMLYRLFLDGKRRDSLSVRFSHPVPHQRLYLAARGGRTGWFRGAMEEFRIWRRIRSDYEIGFFRGIALTGYEEGLLLLYNFDQISGGFILNGSQEKGLDATAYNSPRIVASTAPLRLEFNTFRAEADADSVTIMWETFDEREIRRFELEKRLESGSYFTLARRDANKSPENYNAYAVRDALRPNAVCYYRLRQVNEDGSEHLSTELPIGEEAVHNFALEKNVPDPFGVSVSGSAETTIAYRLLEDTRVDLTVYNIVGRLVRDLVNTRQKAGNYSVVFDGKDLPPGVYFFKLRTESGSETKKMVLEK